MKAIEYYQQELKAHGYHTDPAQLRAIERLQACEDEWVDYKHVRSNELKKKLFKPSLPRGVYLWGGVGRGKSFLMDCFFAASPLEKKIRIHFHEFMREVHRELHELSGLADPLDELAIRISKRYRLICFDEFHINDIADAMILYRLLKALFEDRVQFVMTSNYRPDQLYPDGLHRDRLLPAIRLLEEKLDVLNVDAGNDYRRLQMEQVDAYLTPITSETDLKLLNMFYALIGNRAEDPNPILYIESRELLPLHMGDGVVWFDFETLCCGPRSQNDYLEIAKQFHTVILSGVPYMPPRLTNEARRFIWLVDVLYDNKNKLIISAAVPAAELYTEGQITAEFSRTVSRLIEMQSRDYLDAPRRIHSSALT
ncbi:cell division protein ZapE [Polynucleobacter paneuropaeus]|uniref:Cell division protein ZapE n=1 Tax=Polynucleobacter paneuropaeus TaxID=2527775 RepID=A0ABX9F9N5_9BURK|nr:cell division protein ZapE [Polynucleobacter paneuropaeus]AWW46193.1 cell division protein ZapE [Polynucleobacter paneuropaeus]MBT8516159.1 cell division protein ZapE [Polynucleobacter paneuropaeus]MBT8519394.1 cell division protein ZapE [Polynucleobacter paneuropaeus]MBT8524186.1 cell division protein ZapE [Polynucleobacter paneuropaeus]MBT8546824.1 cell division protein ZapE [Polynucleobacter paneuropaeus]